MQPKLGIIAGGGIIPRSLVHHCNITNRQYCVVALSEHAERAYLDGLENLHWSRIGAAGKIIELLKGEGVRELVMVGAVKRPSLLTVVPDLRGLWFLLRAGRRAFRGDNSLLSAIADELEIEGFRVVGIDCLLASLVTPLGILTRVSPDPDTKPLIQAGLMAAKKHGQKDIGQAVVIKGDKVIAYESSAGTNELIKRAAEISEDKDTLILIKAMKPGQDRRIDLPTMGPETVKLAVKYGFCGIVMEAGNSLLVEKESSIELADSANIFILGV